MAKQFKVTTPAKDHTGEVVGVAFVKGEAVVSDDEVGALQYFRRHGYGIEPARRASGGGKGKGGDNPTPTANPDGGDNPNPDGDNKPPAGGGDKK